jgi:hypothetical protein
MKKLNLILKSKKKVAFFNSPTINFVPEKNRANPKIYKNPVTD